MVPFVLQQKPDSKGTVFAFLVEDDPCRREK